MTAIESSSRTRYRLQQREEWWVGGRARSTVRASVPEDTPQAAGTSPEDAACVSRVTSVSDAAQRRDELKAVWEQASACQKCPQLASTRQTVVFGAGNADADLMFVGEAPGAREDERGLPFVGQAGRLLDQLLGEIGLHAATCSSPTS